MNAHMIPHIEKQNGHPVLMVEGKTFILLAGEVHNSDASSPAYMEHIWNIARNLGMNALLLPVSWELIEPEEDCFDFSIPKALIDQAREREMRIVFLWFCSWKNAECMYAPAWVKQDLKRFPRAQIEKGKNKAGRTVSPSLPYKVPYTTLSYLSEEAVKADAKAFSALAAFLKEYDGVHHTVVALQVENETGLLGAAREISSEADEVFEAEVPADFAAYLRAHAYSMTDRIRTAVLNGKEHGNWLEVFGAAADELFSAYHVARFVNRVAAAGKAIYPLPMAVNCWLDRDGKPGDYPTGGPISKMREVWDFCAPDIDIYGPDIYVPQFKEVCDEYTRRGDALFIPECATHSYAAPRLLYTIGHYHAMCYSPFGFDDIGKPFTAQQSVLFGVDVSDPALKTPQSFEEYAAIGQILREMMPMLSASYGTDCLQAASAEIDPDGTEMDFGSFRINVLFQRAANSRSDGACLCLKVNSCECWLVGNACSVSLYSGDEASPNLDLLLLEEGQFENGAWHPGRRLNGDEAAHMAMDKSSVWHIRFFSYR